MGHADERSETLRSLNEGYNAVFIVDIVQC